MVCKRFSKGCGPLCRRNLSDILSVFEDRNEKEVVVDPEQIEIVNTENEPRFKNHPRNQ